MKISLSLETLPEVRNGAVALAFDKALRKAIEDVESAPDIATARVVSLEVKLTPVLDGMELDTVDVEVMVKGKAPPRSTTVRMQPRVDRNQVRMLEFEELSDSVEQPQLPLEN